MSRRLSLLLLAQLFAALPCFAQQNLLKNPGFEQAGNRGVPAGWTQYAGGVPESQLQVVTTAHSGAAAVRLLDTGPNVRDNKYAIGVQQDVPCEPGKFYLGSVWAKALARNHEQAVILQLTFLPGNQSFSRNLTGPVGGNWQRYSVGAVAPEGSKTCRMYLYTMHFWTSDTILDDAALEIEDPGSGLNTSLWHWGHEPLQQVRPLKLQTVLTKDAQPAAVIACPNDSAWKQVATDLQLAIQRKTGATLMLYTDLKPLLRTDQTIVALGNMNNNFVIERLYFNHYTKADSLYPGPGNFALRTVHQPFNFHDINVLTIEASDLAGAKAGVTELLKHLPDSPGCALDQPLLLVSTTKPATEAAAKKIVDNPVTQDLFCDFWQAVQQYRETGETAWALRAKRVMGLCEDRLVKNPTYRITWPEETTSDQIGAMWDVIEEVPVWSDAERLQAVNCLFATMLSLPRHVTYWGTFANNDTVLFNHSTFPLIGIFFIDRYLQRYYTGQDAVFDEHMAQVDGAFRGQVKSWKPQCDADSYLTIVPRHTIEYTLANNDYTYFENGQVRQFAEYLTHCSDNIGSIPGFGDSGISKGPGYELSGLPIALWYYKDPRYLWRLQQIYDGKWQNPYDQTLAPRPWTELAGLTVTRLAPEFYRWLTTVPSYEEPLRQPAVSLADGFDKITFRENIEKDCPFLLLDGIARGKHLHYDGNAIIKYHADGEDWLVDGDYLVRNTTEHNMLSVIKNGRADVLEPPLARLDACADLDTCAFTRSTVANYNGADWTRNILWLKGVGFVVLDEMRAKEDAEFTFEDIFKTQDLGDHKLTGGRIYSVTRPTNGGSGSRDLALVTDFLPEVPKAVRFGQPESRLEFPVELPAGKYAVTLWAQGKDGGTDSFWVSIDGGTDIAFHIPYDHFGPSADSWTKDTRTPNVTIARDGTHLFRVTLRENPGLVLQKVTIATPDGKEIKTIDAWNPPPLPKEQFQPAPDKRFLVKNDGLCQTTVSSRTNNVTLKFEYLHQVTSRRMKAGEFAHLANVFYSDRSDKPVNLDLTPAANDGVLLSRAGKPWARLDTHCGGRAAATVVFKDRVLLVGVTNWRNIKSDRPFSCELKVGNPYATAYATATTTVTVGGKQQVLQPGKGRLDVGGVTGLQRLLADLPGLVATPQSRARSQATAAGAKPPSMAARWTLPAVTQDDHAAVINRLVAADVNGDGAEEMLVGWGRNCVCLDGAGKQLWSLETGARVNDACVADLDGDGKPEVLIGSDDENFYLTDNAGKLLSKTHCDAPLRVGTSSVRDPRVSNVAVADLDRDGKLDLIIGTRNGNVCRYALPSPLTASPKMLWNFNQIEHGTISLRLLDLNGDGKLEIVAANRYGSVEVVSNKGEAMPNTYSELGDVVFDVADLDGDGKPEIVNGSSTGALTCTRWADKAMWRFDNFGYGAKDVRCGDFDGDGKLETALASETGYVYLIGPDGKAKATQRLGSAVLSLAVVGAGPQQRLVAGCRDGMVYLLDGALKLVASYQTPGPVAWMTVQKDKNGKRTLLAAGGDTLAAIVVP